MGKIVNLIYVGVDGPQSNKYYNMLEEGSNFKVEYGRVGSSKIDLSYPIEKWNSIYRDKIKKGYKDITEFKVAEAKIENSGNIHFDEFFNYFNKYATNSVRSNYLVEGCTKAQLAAAQRVINDLTIMQNIDNANLLLMELYKVIPRRMSNVRDYLAKSPEDLQRRIAAEQDAIDAMDSNNIVITSNPLQELNVSFDVISSEDLIEIQELIYGTSRGFIIHKGYKVTTRKKPIFDDWLSKQQNKNTKLLIHGTRNPNIFSILKSDLLIRPTNAASISGNAYGDGIYHSAHAQKSLGYTGSDPDKIFFMQRVHMGNHYTYNGYYRDGKDISRNEMNYSSLKRKGFDSLFVQAGDGLLNSEYIVYNQEQTTTNFLIWLKQK